MLRNPVDLVYSFHEQLVYLTYENISDFSHAWNLSERRALGSEVTSRCHEPKLLDYKSVGRLGEQVTRLFKTVPRERILVLVLDDMKSGPHREYLKVLNFLGVPDDGRLDFPVRNPSKERQWPRLQNLIVRIGKASMSLRRNLKIPISRGTGLLEKFSSINTKFRQRIPLSQDFRKDITHYYKEDIQLLSAILERDFSNWLRH